jgi:hypothetical protein
MPVRKTLVAPALKRANRQGNGTPGDFGEGSCLERYAGDGLNPKLRTTAAQSFGRDNEKRQPSFTTTTLRHNKH